MNRNTRIIQQLDIHFRTVSGRPPRKTYKECAANKYEKVGPRKTYKEVDANKYNKVGSRKSRREEIREIQKHVPRLLRLRGLPCR